MRAVDIIIKKRDRGELTKEEIEFFIRGFTTGEISDYQAAAWAMAVLLNGMSTRETTDLTLALVRSGDTLDLSGVVPLAVDKHSTGGVGDKTTLVVEPLVASCGLAVGKISGRGLGFSGGTLDKVESIPGFRVDLTTDEFLEQLRSIGLVLNGQTADLTPADGKLYSLRDVTGTVQSIPLIASSIMSKKIAGGANAILLDVKTGSGAFMHNLHDARELAELMVAIGEGSRRKAVALLSDMNQPLGQAVGNALEVLEAIQTLHNEGPQDFREHCLVVAANMLVLGGRASNPEHGREVAERALRNGGAWEKFKNLVVAQGGDVAFVEQPERLPKARYQQIISAPRSGFLSQIDALVVGQTACFLGAGREKKGDPVDHAVGIEVLHKVGDKVAAGNGIFKVHANQESKLEEAQRRLFSALKFSDTLVEPLPLHYGVIGG